MTMQFSNPRLDRLQDEQKRLLDLQNDSDHVRVAAVDELPGRPPERYKVTFLCRGIAAIDGSQEPIYSSRHEVEIYCDEEFPSNVPRLKWLSSVWHPNIQHHEPKNVCVNKSEWMGSSGLDDLCQQMFEMVQYRNYHAENIPPYPLDPEAAKWVRDYAEPRGIVNKHRGIFVDNRPFYKPKATSERAIRIKIRPSIPGVRVQIGAAKARSAEELDDKRRRAATAVGRCNNCGSISASDVPFCVKCGAKLREVRRINIG